MRWDARHGKSRPIGITDTVVVTGYQRLNLLRKIFRLGWHFRFQSEG